MKKPKIPEISQRQRLTDPNELNIFEAGPELRNVTDRVHFDIKEGIFWVDSQRSLVLQAEWFNELRHELISKLGHQQARTLIARLGYSAGCRDAKLALKIHSPDALKDLLYRGAQTHALHGSVLTIPKVLELSPDNKSMYMEFVWLNSIEGHGHVELYGTGTDPACWMDTGYVSGYITTCIGTPTLVREIECVALGHSQCRSVARFAHEWEADLEIQETPIPFGSLSEVDLSKINILGHEHKHVQPQESPVVSQSSSYVIGRSTAFYSVLHQVHQVSDTMATVLLLGESGVGKSAFAKEVHIDSRRKNGPFIEVNCAAIPDTLIESELFGVEKGAFTGATASRAGRFEEAEGGTLFLDEIGTLSLSAQGKILRVLQNQQFERLGSSKTLHANVRLVAATNEDLQTAIDKGRFRLDLFYRLNVFPIHVPPLRERKLDLPDLIEYFIRNYIKRHSKYVSGILPRAYNALLGYDWPGNIRELENILERAVILCPEGEALDMVHLFTNSHAISKSGHMSLSEKGGLTPFNGEEVFKEEIESDNSWVFTALQDSEKNLFDFEKDLILATLKQTNSNIAQAAKRLGISRAQIDYRLKKWEVLGNE